MVFRAAPDVVAAVWVSPPETDAACSRSSLLLHAVMTQKPQRKNPEIVRSCAVMSFPQCRLVKSPLFGCAPFPRGSHWTLSALTVHSPLRTADLRQRDIAWSTRFARHPHAVAKEQDSLAPSRCCQYDLRLRIANRDASPSPSSLRGVQHRILHEGLRFQGRNKCPELLHDNFSPGQLRPSLQSSLILFPACRFVSSETRLHLLQSGAAVDGRHRRESKCWPRSACCGM